MRRAWSVQIWWPRPREPEWIITQALGQTERPCGRRVGDLVDRLHLQEVVSRAQAAHLVQAPRQRPVAHRYGIGAGEDPTVLAAGEVLGVAEAPLDRLHRPAGKHPAQLRLAADLTPRPAPSPWAPAAPARPSAPRCGRAPRVERRPQQSYAIRDVEPHPARRLPASTSVAATPPIGNPYPSARPASRRRRPRSPAATFDLVERTVLTTSGNSSRSANTIPGTRMAPTGSIRHRHGVSSTNSTTITTSPARGRPLRVRHRDDDGRDGRVVHDVDRVATQHQPPEARPMTRSQDDQRRGPVEERDEAVSHAGGVAESRGTRPRPLRLCPGRHRVEVPLRLGPAQVVASGPGIRGGQARPR